MQCQTCKAENPSSARFCANCGNALEGSAWEAEQTAAARRQEVADRIAQLCAQFEEQRASYDRMAALDRSVAYYRAKLAKWPGWPFFLSVVFAAPILWSLWIQWQSGSALSQGYPIAIAGSALLSVISLIPLIIVILMRVARGRAVKRNSEEMGRLFAATYNHYLSVPRNPFAFEYSDPYSLEALCRIVRMGKADTAKEAINVLEQSKYQSSMLNLQGMILEEAQNVKRATMAAAAFAGIAAFRYR